MRHPTYHPEMQEEFESSSEFYEFEDEVNRKSKNYIKWIQSSLNKIMGFRLVVDGIIGPKTRSAIRSFQSRKGLSVDGIVGPNTEAALIRSGAVPPPGSGAGTPSPGTPPPVVSPSPGSGSFVQLPNSGQGFTRYEKPDYAWGHPQVIQAMVAIASNWYKAHPSGPRIQVGDMSIRTGGLMKDVTDGHARHKSHQKGLDVDIRPMRSDSKEIPVQYTDSFYSRVLTQELVSLIRANKVLGIKSILFNDSGVKGVVPYLGHNNHLHVTFNQPSSSSPSSSSPSPSYPSPGSPATGGSLRNNLVNIALQEWNRWGNGSKKESDSAMSPVIKNYWEHGVGIASPGVSVAWSAAFISWVVKQAGGGANFRYSGAHTTYTYFAKQNRVQTNTNPFKTYRITEKKPEPGDIIVQNRGSSAFTYDNLQPDKPGTHGDIVVKVNMNTIEVIGGNLSDSVSKNTYNLNSNGFLNTAHFAIIKIEELSTQNEWNNEFELRPEFEGPEVVSAGAAVVSTGFEILRSTISQLAQGDIQVTWPSSAIGVIWAGKPNLKYNSARKSALIVDYRRTSSSGTELVNVKLRCQVQYNGPEVMATFSFDAEGKRSRLGNDSYVTINNPLSLATRPAQAQWQRVGIREYPVIYIPIEFRVDHPWPSSNYNLTFTLVLSGMHGFGETGSTYIIDRREVWN